MLTSRISKNRILRRGDSFFRALFDSRGFTLIELVVVLVIFSIIALSALPRISGFLNTERKGMAILTGMAVAAFDDALVSDRINYLVIHLDEDEGRDKDDDELFRRRNGVSVVSLSNGKFVESERKMLKHREFNENFILDEVILSTGEKITTGNVLIPFYPDGHGDDIILHVKIEGDEQWTVRMYRFIKEPLVRKGYLTFEDETPERG